jgi:hypothetical protein
MSRSHPFILSSLIALAATAPALSQQAPPQPPPPASPVSPPGRVYTPELLAFPDASVALDQCVKLITVDMAEMKRKGPRSREGGENPSPEQLKAEAEARAIALKKIAELRVKIAAFDPKSNTITTPALTLIDLTNQLTAVHQQIFTTLDSGKAMNSPEVKALFARAVPLRDRHADTMQQLIIQLKLIKAEDEANTAKAAATAPAAPATQPTPAAAPVSPAAPSPTGSIVPQKSSSKTELPPGVTRRQPGQ